MAAVTPIHPVAKGLMAKAYLGVIVSLLGVGLSLWLFTLPWQGLVYPLIAGIVAGACLLAYWYGKGGIYFFITFLMPLLTVMLTPMPELGSLVALISGFFLGGSSVLAITNMRVGSAFD